MVYIPFADISSVVGVNLCKRAVFVLVLYFSDFVRKHPAVPRDNALFFVLLQINFVSHFNLLKTI